jgi:Leucine-rich repeat (LRR) protein
MKKILSLSLALVMLAALLPVAAVPVVADAEGNEVLADKECPSCDMFGYWDGVYCDSCEELWPCSWCGQTGVYCPEEMCNDCDRQICGCWCITGLTYREVFPDPNFRSSVIMNVLYGTRNNQKEAFIKDYTPEIASNRVITSDDAAKIASLSRLDVSDENITDMTGIEYFTGLEELHCSNNRIASLNLSRNIALRRLDCSNNQLTTLDVSKNTALTAIFCSNNRLTSLDVSRNTAMRTLVCFGNDMGIDPDVSISGWRSYWNNYNNMPIGDGGAIIMGRLYYYPQGGAERSGIDYSNEDNIIIEGTVTPAGFINISLNLNSEYILIPTAFNKVRSFSLDGGVKWRNVRDPMHISGVDHSIDKYLRKDLDLHISNRFIDRKTKNPGEGAVIVSFPTIKKRASAPRVTPNFAIGADNTGATPGYWSLVNRSDARNPNATPLKDGYIITEIDPDRAFNWGQFFKGENDYGIPVYPRRLRIDYGAMGWLEYNYGKNIMYHVRTAPKHDSSGYTAASKSVRLRVANELNAPNYKVKDNTISVRSNTFVRLPDGTVTHYEVRTRGVPVVSGMQVWQGATARRSASAKQSIP